VVWFAFGLLFIAPFIDPRRPFRLLHFDLLALVGAGFVLVRILEIGGPMSQFHAGIVLLAVGLLYLLVRMLMVGFRPRRPTGPLVPLVPMTWLLVALIGLACFRIAYVKVDPTGVVDVGRVSADGANRIAEGKGLYDELLSGSDPHGNTYGPVMYLAYVPFERAAKWSGREGSGTPTDAEVRRGYAWAARAAAVTFDLLTMLGLFVLGGRMHARNGRALGLVLAFAWASCPYTLYVLIHGSNDGLVALLLVAALLVLGSPPLRGAATALAAATKFAPGAIVPLFATAANERRGHSALVFAASFILVSAVIFLPLIPDGGVRELYDRTIGFQASRSVGITVWWLFPELQAVQPAARVAAVGLALVLALVPARRGPLQVAALGAATILAFELTVTYWLPSYVLWFAPFAFVALFAPYGPDQVFGRARVLSPGRGKRAAASA
jgi:hypothetical protein